jgi:hypothetical protein
VWAKGSGASHPPNDETQNRLIEQLASDVVRSNIDSVPTEWVLCHVAYGVAPIGPGNRPVLDVVAANSEVLAASKEASCEVPTV